MKQINWFDRTFEFPKEQNIFPAIIDRLEGTLIRLDHKIASAMPESLIYKSDGKWSVQEHIGHLADLEPLWQGRLVDILKGLEIMREADLTNKKTEEANHNQRSIEEVFTDFKSLRLQTIQSLNQLSEEEVFKSSLHPRLMQPMRILDLFLFTAEHDDHHLVMIKQIVNANNDWK